MSNIPAELKYVESHEWLRLEADGSVTVGITAHAQELLGDIVFVELPKVGANLAKEEQAGAVESVKAASDVYCPIAGEVLEVNGELEGAPDLANNDPYGDGWFFKIKPANASDLDGLMDAAAYAKEIGA
ncbi:glycine cleavage system protein GcvH [Chromobacterium amazonense]|uniref:Glycine cleavage system H protein n=1 Tax=Chromobacterium amazonense TaxID=1382803 RepID=A0A2S9X2S5_9NEIS|nr:glycine cleavage system protein GcvH [Chromobacterium amazonense]KIA82074.1 glycine cleavage system protein H [Chromobacterium piscinae]MDQ4542444.1 glycine cleavage system protein GcvH [Chromobacterium amazonense]PRP70029.1 glycine cleavage system protein H [Chromobacterium amazonense]